MQFDGDIKFLRIKNNIGYMIKPVFLSAVLMSSLSPASAQLATIDKIPELMQAYQVDGMAVTAVQGDKILVAKGFGVKANGEAYTSSSQCGLFSATKALSSLTYTNLVKDKRINLDAPLSDYIKNSPSLWNDIEFYRLLNHTSGITMIVNKKIFGGIVTNPASQNKDIYNAIKDAPLDYNPGQYSRYRQSGYAVAEMILKESLDIEFDDLMAQYITKPAAMVNTHHISKTDDKEAAFLLSAGGYQTNANDMARLFLNINNGKIVNVDQWLSLLMNPKYRFEDYSLGAFFETKDDILTVGHRGGGARANIRYAPEQKIGTMVCTDDRSNNELAIALAQMLIYEIATGKEPLTPIRVGLAGYENKTADQIVSIYKTLSSQQDDYDFSETASLLNNIGYEMLARDEIQDAITIFSLGVEVSPKSSNAHDSLGEAFLKSGQNDKALFHYRESLSLDFKNSKAESMIKQILASNDKAS